MENKLNIIEAVINGEKQLAVNARELWKALESKQQFSDWIKNRLKDFDADVDYLRHKIMEQLPSGAATHKIEYTLTLDTAKHLCMVERNEIGKKIRQYFIEIEKGARKLFAEKEMHSQVEANEERDVIFDTTQTVLKAVGARIAYGENVPSHIVKFCWNMANLVKIPYVFSKVPAGASIGAVDPLIAGFVNSLPVNQVIPKKDVYDAYCAQCGDTTPLSPRGFWPAVKRCADVEERRDANCRYIIIKIRGL